MINKDQYVNNAKEEKENKKKHENALANQRCGSFYKQKFDWLNIISQLSTNVYPAWFISCSTNGHASFRPSDILRRRRKMNILKDAI